jgi:hypothetical protein
MSVMNEYRDDKDQISLFWDAMTISTDELMKMLKIGHREPHRHPVYRNYIAVGTPVLRSGWLQQCYQEDVGQCQKFPP